MDWIWIRAHDLQSFCLTKWPALTPKEPPPSPENILMHVLRCQTVFISKWFGATSAWQYMIKHIHLYRWIIRKFTLSENWNYVRRKHHFIQKTIALWLRSLRFYPFKFGPKPEKIKIHIDIRKKTIYRLKELLSSVLCDIWHMQVHIWIIPQSQWWSGGDRIIFRSLIKLAITTSYLSFSRWIFWLVVRPLVPFSLAEID